MSEKTPTDFHPDLHPDHITAVGKLIVAAYHESLEHYLEDKGDNRWSHGVRRYAWSCQNIRDAVESGKMPFLSILVDIGNTFIFRIGAVPVKFKRTNPDDPADSVLKQSLSETQQLSLLEFAGIHDPCELRWRMVVEDDFDGDVIRIVFLGLNESKVTKCFWEIPQAKIAAHITVLDEHKDEGVELAPAKVGLRGAENKEEKQA